ncbi:hypothetical protein D3C74_140860 [compost metagenome]
MSFVSIVMSNDFLTIMSDGRVSGLEYEIEDFQKFVCSNDGKSFVAFSGDRTGCEIISQEVLKSFQLGIPYKTISKELIEFIDRNFGYNVVIKIAFGGIGEHGEIEVYNYDYPSKEETYFHPSEREIDYIFLCNVPKTLRPEVANKFGELLNETGKDSPSSIIQAQKLLNNYVSSFDNTVNKKTFRAVIKKH